MPGTTRFSLLPLLAGVALVACGGGGDKPTYAKDGDTGAAAPATQQTLSPQPNMGDSTAGVAHSTGVGNAAGDTLGAMGKAAGQPQMTPGTPGAPSGTPPNSGTTKKP